MPMTHKFMTFPTHQELLNSSWGYWRVSMRCLCGCVLTGSSPIQLKQRYYGCPRVASSSQFRPPCSAWGVMLSHRPPLFVTWEFISTHSGLTMTAHISKTVSYCYASLRQIRSICRSLPKWVMLSLIAALVLTRLDGGNATLVGLPAHSWTAFSTFFTQLLD